MKFVINKKQVRNIIFRLTGEDELNVTAPLYMDNKKIESIIYKNMSKIKKLVEDDKNRISYENPKDLSYIYLFGEKITLEQTENKKTYFKDGILYIAKNKNIEREIDKFYKKEMEDYLAERVKFYEKILGKGPENLRLRKMKSRWGTCYKDRSLIILNTYLAKRKKEDIDYVLAHEMTHLFEDNHSKDFYKLLEQIEPNYKKIRSQMGRV